MKISKLQYANISLIKNDSIIEGLITDEKGRFIFEKIEIGDYKLLISFVGFENIELNNISLADSIQYLMLKQLFPSSNMLEETIVTGNLYMKINLKRLFIM